MQRPIRQTISLLLLLAGALSCGDDGIAGPGSTELARAESRWNRSGIGAGSYTMHQFLSCFCLDAGTVYEITVSDNAIIRVVHAASGAELPASQYGRFRTVTALFDEIRVAIVRGNVLTAALYDPALGYPATVSLDRVPEAVDDEVSYVTRNVLRKP